MAEKPEALRIGVLHGPNLNLLGAREPEIYGHANLSEVDERLDRLAGELGVEVTSQQSNREGELVEWVQAAGARFDGLLVNAAGYTHSSVALRDALAACGLPFVEVHISNIFAREPFRHHSYLSDLAVGVVTGLGVESYLLALRGLVAYLRRS